MESTQEFIPLECQVNITLDHHLMTMTQGLFRTDGSLKDHMVSKTFPTRRRRTLVFSFIFQRAQKIFWLENRYQNETATKNTF